MKLGFGFPAKSKVTLEHAGTSETVDSWGQAHVALTGEAGRINVYDAALTAPTQGAAIARPDGKTVLNLLDMPDAGDVVATLPNNRKAVVRAGERQQQRGHPNGEHYWLPTDANDRFVCEPGARHRKMYVSKSGTAMTKAQVAAHAGVAESAVTGAWLVARPQYGGTVGMAVHFDVFLLYFNEVFGWAKPGRSDHYFFERGHDYSAHDWVFAHGEAEIHPMLIGAWGTGDRPLIGWGFIFVAPVYTVLQDVELKGATQPWYSFATAYDHLTVETTLDLQWTSAFTIRDVIVKKPWPDKPKATTDNGTKWLANGNHVCGIYSSGADRLLVDGIQIDHAGWGDGYDPNGDATKPCPPFKYAHAIYLATDVYDVTLRNNLLTRAASCGYQLRAGQHVEGNLLVDHNLIAAINSSSGFGQFNNVMDNVAFSAGYKRVAYEEGAFNWGFDCNGPLSAMKGNVIAHHANPDDEAEKTAKGAGASEGVIGTAKLVDDTQVWKWGPASQNRNVGGLNARTLDQTTIQRYAGSKVGQTFQTIPQFVAWAKTQPSISAVVKDAVDWSKGRFGKPRSARMAPASLTFSPDPDFEGFRWDNRYNWSTQDLPGRNAGDMVDLRGHYTKFGNMNAEIGMLSSGGGVVDAVSGKLKIGALSDAARITTRMAGQIALGATGKPLAIRADSGRVTLLGTAADLDLVATGHAEVLLGPDCTIPVGKSLVIGGQRSLVGWDGNGTAKMTVKGVLKFGSGMEVILSAADMGVIRYAWQHIGKEVTGSISGVRAKVAAVDKWGPRTEIKLWLSEIAGTPQAGDVFTFAPRRKDDGTEEAQKATVTSIVSRGIAPLQCFRSGIHGTAAPTVTATVTLAAGSTVTVDKTGLAAGNHDLTGPGVTVVDQGAALPAGISVSGGKLVLAV